MPIFVWSLVGLVVGFAIGFLAEQLLAADRPDISPTRAFRRRLMAGVIGAIVGHIGMQSLIIQDIIVEVHRQILAERLSDYEKARKWYSQQDKKTKYIFDEIFARVDPWLKGMSTGDTRLGTAMAVDIWSRGFGIAGSGDEILATNTLSQKDWNKFSLDIKIQAAAAIRGVKVKRVMIYDPVNLKNQDDLRKLAKPQLQAGVEVKEISIQSLLGPEYDRLVRLLGGLDFVLFGSFGLLIAETHPISGYLTGARLVVEREKMAAARELHGRIWAVATAIPK